MNLHFDKKDEGGCIIFWSHDTDEAMGGGFFVPDLRLHFEPCKLTVLRLASDEWFHGSEEPTNTTGGKMRYGMALLNKVDTIKMAKKQAADPNAPPPGLPLSKKRREAQALAASKKKTKRSKSQSKAASNKKH